MCVTIEQSRNTRVKVGCRLVDEEIYNVTPQSRQKHNIIFRMIRYIVSMRIILFSLLFYFSFISFAAFIRNSILINMFIYKYPLVKAFNPKKCIRAIRDDAFPELRLIFI